MKIKSPSSTGNCGTCPAAVPSVKAAAKDSRVVPGFTPAYKQAPGSAPVAHKKCVAPPSGLPPGSKPRFMAVIRRSMPIESVSMQERVRAVMRTRHKLRPGVKDDFSMETSESALEFWNKIEGYLVIAGVALPAIGLVVGAIVIMNIMLVAVAERTREIGIRKALGAKRRDILAQFLVESATLSTVGAILGIAMGIGLAQAIAAVTPLPASVAPWSIIVGVAVGMGVGIVSGVYPASRASRLDPVVALRQE